MDLSKFKLKSPFAKKKKAKNVAGLDIGSFEVKLTVLHSDEKGNVSLVKAGKRPLPHGTIVDKDVRDREGLIFALQSLVDEVAPDITEVAFSLSGHKVLVDRVEIRTPTGKGKPEEQIRESIMVEAEQRIPTGIDSVQLDYFELGQGKDEKHIQAMLVAARNELVEDYVGIIMDSGVVPILIDLDSIALYNLFEFNHDIPQEGCIALVDIGHSLSNAAFILDGRLFSIRDISNAARGVWDRLQTELHLSSDDLAELMLGEVPMDESPTIRKAVNNASEDLGIGMSMAFSYLENMTGGTKVQKVFLSGGALGITFLVDALSNRLGIPCELIDSLGRIRFDQAVFGEMPIDFAKAVYAISIGLALRAREIV
ncbi:hypothetical protein DRQ33_02245 [bacterium]|nr:MAG: hypothetical protein DRQ33_02245 [bacterium]